MNKALLVFTLAAALGIPVWAQQTSPQDSRQNLEDPPDAADHAVARLSFLSGKASIARGDAGETSAAIANDPLVTGDRLITSTDGRAELQFDAANLVRVAPGTEIRMGDLRYQRALIQIARGMVTFRVLREGGAQTEISTPSSSLRPLGPGTYRVLVRTDGTSEFTIRAGEAEIFSPAGSEMMQAGTTMFSRGPVDNPEFMTAQAIPFDEWDRFSAVRDRAFERYAEVSRYAAAGPEVAGMEDLSGYGRWTYDPDYGNVWVPTVNATWTPYSDGRWDWIDYYGWSWVSYDPWGWAPYHYGRWYHGSWGWAWYPGFGRAGFGVAAQHYWRPALVGFVGWGSPGFGSNFALGFGAVGFGNVGWVPLAPREAFRPWYGRGLSRGSSFAANIGAVSSYQNVRFNAVTGVSAAEFGRGGRFFGPALGPAFGNVARAGAVGAPQALVGRAAATGPAMAPRFFSAQSALTGRQYGGWRRFEPSSAQSGQAVRINPPIVNMRTQNSPRNTAANNPSYAGPSSFAGFGGPRQTVPGPAVQQPRYPAPASIQRMSTPGGGGFRSGNGGNAGRNGPGHR